jgi:hypothetical protein
MNSQNERCPLCGARGVHAHDRNMKPIFVGSRVRLHRMLAIVRELRMDNAAVQYVGERWKRLANYSLLELDECLIV